MTRLEIVALHYRARISVKCLHRRKKGRGNTLERLFRSGYVLRLLPLTRYDENPETRGWMYRKIPPYGGIWATHKVCDARYALWKEVSRRMTGIGRIRCPDITKAHRRYRRPTRSRICRETLFEAECIGHFPCRCWQARFISVRYRCKPAQIYRACTMIRTAVPRLARRYLP